MINCLACNSPNEDSAQHCIVCGSDLPRNRHFSTPTFSRLQQRAESRPTGRPTGHPTGHPSKTGGPAPEEEGSPIPALPSISPAISSWGSDDFLGPEDLQGESIAPKPEEEQAVELLDGLVVVFAVRAAASVQWEAAAVPRALDLLPVRQAPV